MKKELVIVLDFGGQYNQLVARRVRECNVYCEIYSYKTDIEKIKAMNPKGIILTGGPNSCYEADSPTYSKELFELGVPVLGLCYGAQLMMHVLGGKVERADVREYGKTGLMICEEGGITRERVRLLTTVKILAGEKQFRDEINKKVEQFEICYPKLIKGGFFAIVIIPIVFLILMFSITSKMVFLVLWIVSIILIALYLICVEFIHENLLNKQKMAEMTGDELIEQLKKRGRKNSKEGDED